MYRFFAGHNDLSAASLELTDAGEIHHLRDVLRLKPSDTLALFDGRGQEVVGEIQTSQRDRVIILLREHSHQPRATVPIILACAIPKKSKFESIVEKCTELGIDEIIPLLTKRTEVRLEGERAHRKADRYHTVALNAAKQCRRSWLPAVHPLTRFTDALKLLRPQDIAFIPHLTAPKIELPQYLDRNKSLPARIILFIGPEGDFTSDEIKRAEQAGAKPLSLGPTVLKVDTAACSSVAIAASLLRNHPAAVAAVK